MIWLHQHAPCVCVWSGHLFEEFEEAAAKTKVCRVHVCSHRQQGQGQADRAASATVVSWREGTQWQWQRWWSVSCQGCSAKSKRCTLPVYAAQWQQHACIRSSGLKAQGIEAALQAGAGPSIFWFLLPSLVPSVGDAPLGLLLRGQQPVENKTHARGREGTLPIARAYLDASCFTW